MQYFLDSDPDRYQDSSQIFIAKRLIPKDRRPLKRKNQKRVYHHGGYKVFELLISDHYGNIFTQSHMAYKWKYSGITKCSKCSWVCNIVPGPHNCMKCGADMKSTWNRAEDCIKHTEIIIHDNQLWCDMEEDMFMKWVDAFKGGELESKVALGECKSCIKYTGGCE